MNCKFIEIDDRTLSSFPLTEFKCRASNSNASMVLKLKQIEYANDEQQTRNPRLAVKYYFIIFLLFFFVYPSVARLILILFF